MRRYIFLWFIIFMTVIMKPIKGQSMELVPTKIRVGLFITIWLVIHIGYLQIPVLE